MIAVTMGDPSGVGPEIALKAFSSQPRRIHVGDPEVYYQTAKHLGLNIRFQEVNSPEEAIGLSVDRFAILPTLHRADPCLSFGKSNPNHAKATVESIRTACQLALNGRVGAMVTPPINKGVLHAAGFKFPGHTELLADHLGVTHPVMMLAGEGLRVVPATIHQSIVSVAQMLTADFLENTIRITHHALQRDFNLPNPRIVLTGLNPHAGEKGAFGREEIETIIPVCQKMADCLQGSLQGPLPADSLFHPEARKAYDAVICMYHDQALIPLKMLAFGKAVNVTLGLPIIRTSVDHGTAYDIAGLGVANRHSFVEAVTMAGILANNRESWNSSQQTRL